MSDSDVASQPAAEAPQRSRESSGREGGWSRPARAEGDGGNWSRPARTEAPQPAAAPAAAPAGNWNRGDGGRQREWNGNRDSGRAATGWSRRVIENARDQAEIQAQAQAAAPAAAPQARSWTGGNRSGSNWGSDNRGRSDGNQWRGEGRRDDARRDDSRRDWNRDGRSGDRAWSRNDGSWNRGDRSWHRNDNSWNRSDRSWDRNRSGYHQDYRRWDNRWRDNRRYDWNSYRRSYPHAYRLPSYYAPYRNYNYRRLSIGFYLDSLFFSSNYWINDPWQYRLPDVYGPYRWVRYYDDALLVNVHTGEVVDVIHSFFW